MNKLHIAILLATLVTFLLRLLPYIFVNKMKISPKMQRLMDKLPIAVMSILIIYCLKDTINSPIKLGIPSLIAIISVFFIHIYKKNTMLSMVIGTIVYMFFLNILK